MWPGHMTQLLCSPGEPDFYHFAFVHLVTSDVGGIKGIDYVLLCQVLRFLERRLEALQGSYISKVSGYCC